MTGKRGRIVRGSVALLVAVSTSIGYATLSSAEPTKKDLEAAQAKLAALNERLSIADEEFLQARLALETVQGKLADVREAARRASEAADGALADLNARAAEAYQGVGSDLELLLGAESFAEFSDRLEFLGRIAQSDADLATKAETARQEARWAADQLANVAQERAEIVRSLAEKEAELKAGVAEAEALVAKIDRALEEAAAAERRAAAEAAAGSGVIEIGPIGSPPAAPNPNAQLAIDAAYSVIGTPYQYAGASPSTGFDCSGLTMWAWAHAGVSLPHSSAAQYAALPHVSKEDLQPGDLVFFYSPIHHVGMYVGGGSMIHSPHTGDVVRVVAIYWQYFVGAARPG